MHDGDSSISWYSQKVQSSTNDWIRWFVRRSRVCSNFFSTSAAPPPQRRRRRTMSKITPDHLSRSAYVYVRQSTPDQLAYNPESRRRQYALADRARPFG